MAVVKDLTVLGQAQFVQGLDIDDVKYTAQTGKTSAQKTQAQTNIGITFTDDLATTDPSNSYYTTTEIDSMIGDIEDALDAILYNNDVAIENSLAQI